MIMRATLTASHAGCRDLPNLTHSALLTSSSRSQRVRRTDAALAERLERLTDEAALNDAVIRLQASELASARVSASEPQHQILRIQYRLKQC